MKNPVCRNLWQ